MKSIIPNTLTALNLFCGSLAVIYFLNNSFLVGIILIFIALLLDFLDGFVARLLNVSSELGKQLDSLADMVSFGLVPGIIAVIALTKSNGANSIVIDLKNESFLPFIGLLLTVFSGIRLAKFNIDTRQSTSFIGLPTPANTLLFLTLPFIWEFYPHESEIYQLTTNTIFLLCLIFIFSYLLIAEIPLIGLKFKNFSWQDNKWKYILIFASSILIFSFSFLAIPFIIILYLILSVFNNLSNHNK